MNRLCISADDIGLTKTHTDTILETVDNGPVRSVSILANGDSLEYAILECAKRKDRLEVAMHFNLTVGAPISSAKDIPHLVGIDGQFRYSPFSLWIAYTFASGNTRKAFRSEVRRELEAQLSLVRSAMSAHGLSLQKGNGHQHVHMIPFVFDELLELSDITEVRITTEPFRMSAFLQPFRMCALMIFSVLGHRHREAAEKKHVAFNNYFLGFLSSGTMTYQAVREGLASVAHHTEILFHPGSASPEEPFPWKGSTEEMVWQFSPWRAKERELLKSAKLKELLDSFQ